MDKPLVLLIHGVDSDCQEFDRYLTSYQLMSATSYQEGRRLFEQHFFNIRVVVIDLGVEDGQGASMVEDLRAISSLPEVIVCSEQKDVNVAVHCMKVGAFDYLVSPFSSEMIQQSVFSALDNMDYLKKIQEFSHSQLLSQVSLEKRLRESTQLRGQKLKDDASLDVADLLDFFPHPDSRDPKFDAHLQGLVKQRLKEEHEKNGKAKILLVEDEHVYRAMMKTMLTDLYDVYEADTLDGAVEQLSSSVQFDVVLLDIFLPDGLGTDLLPKIDDYQSDVEVIIVTAFDLIDKAVQSIRGGASDYLNKPVLKEDILKRVKGALDRKYLRQILPQIRDDFVENRLTSDEKCGILDRLSESRRESGKTILMKDIYDIFPNLRQTFIPDSVAVPDSVLKNGLKGFVDSLEQRFSTPELTDL